MHNRYVCTKKNPFLFGFSDFIATFAPESNQTITKTNELIDDKYISLVALLTTHKVVS